MHSRRAFLGAIGIPALAPLASAAAASAPLRPSRTGAIAANTAPRRDLLALLANDTRSGPALATDEEVWLEVGRAFSVDRTLINLNNGGVCPSPIEVQTAVKHHLDFANQAPAYNMWRVLEPRREAVRQRLARAFGADPEEIAITRNASEGLQICQLGFDLQRGDEVLTTTQDYPRMLTTFEQRARREGIVLRRVSLPVPCEDPAEIVRRLQAAITPRTKLMLVCHVINLTGQVLPVRDIVAMARSRNVPVIVDGAHALAHLVFRLADLDCDYYASSLHKWLCAPHGTGLLYVRRSKIADLWPLMAAPETMAGDIRKFEEIGTHPAANALGIAEALTLHQAIGPERKLARLLWLRDRWAKRLAANERFRLHTSLAPGCATGVACFALAGIDPLRLHEWLWERHHVLTAVIQHDEVAGLRVSPNVYTTAEEIDRFAEAIELVLRDGL